MKITQITVSAGRTFNHPYESYANFRPEVTMTATLPDGADADQAVRDLQAKAETLVEQHKRNLLQNVNDLHESAQIDSELANMEQTLKNAQERMEALKHRRQELSQPLQLQ